MSRHPGKTTLARIIARSTNSIIKELSATSAGSADVRTIFEEAKNVLSLSGRRTVLFVGGLILSAFIPRWPTSSLFKMRYNDLIKRNRCIVFIFWPYSDDADRPRISFCLMSREAGYN